MNLKSVKIDFSYTIVSIDLPNDSLRHLSHLGLKVGSKFKIISKTKNSAIIMLKASRLALDDSILKHIAITEEVTPLKSVPLSSLKAGDFAYIEAIFAVNEAKRRLMDMGLTRHTKILLRKVAPLGDPIEISLRGYELTLRKSEAQLISVVKVGKDQG
ncbi:ferrous iron transport protein A [Streptococcus catagoni]|uniref:ferrous iron transport protein A n=1 Tax=Streptococcus catagoni TaxID=2654874 RepID=UPI00140C464C|nr:ferrous iron transport protein A [Streptococcus catagoni]